MTATEGSVGPKAAILNRFRLDGKVAVVTGASSGLGVAFAEGLASAGADVVLGARREAMLADTVDRVVTTGRAALAVKTDVREPDECEHLASAAVERFGKIDILVNNAGIATAAPATREAPADFRAVYDVNLFGAYWMCKACVPSMPAGGSIVNISSVLGLISVGMPQAAYASSKAALIALTRDLCQQWTGRRGIRVNAVVPGFIPSEMTTDDYPNWPVVMPMIPMGRLGTPEECAAAVVFLASDASSYMSGSVVAVDGGLLTW
jgi:NAD(P)-dependent dehydrogenase (short-subunit alcohol dehydrogenase family)